MKLVFFDELGFLFVSWLRHKSPISQESLELKWETTKVKVVGYEDIPLMHTMPFTERAGFSFNVVETDCSASKKSRIMASMMEEHRYLILCADHDVQVRRDEEGNQKGRRAALSQLPTKRLSRAFNPLEVSCKLLAAYLGMPNQTSLSVFASCHPQSLRCAYVMAIALREVCERIVHDYRLNGLSWIEGDESVEACTVHGLSVSDLLPSKSKQSDALLNNILRVTEAEFT